MLDLRSGKVKRGRITNFRTGYFLEFAVNPADVEQDKTAVLLIDPLPGNADPTVDWIASSANEVKFSLYLDAELRLRLTQAQLFNGAPTVNEYQSKDADIIYSVSGELEFFEQFLYPVHPEVRGGEGRPDLAVLNYGRRYQGVVLELKSFKEKVSEWSPSNDPTKAKLDLEWVRVNPRSRFSGDVWDVPEGLGAARQAQRVLG